MCVLILQSVIQSDTRSFPLFCMAVAAGFRAEEKKELLLRYVQLKNSLSVSLWGGRVAFS
jgi:hypothetical protein